MKLCQLEYLSSDVAASLRFTAAVLGWKKVPISIQDQAIIEVPEQSAFGISIRTRPLNAAETGAAGPLLAYFETDRSLEDVRELCLSLGARIIQEPTFVTGYGQVMIVEETGGLRFGFYEARFVGPKATQSAPPP